MWNLSHNSNLVWFVISNIYYRYFSDCWSKHFHLLYFSFVCQFENVHKKPAVSNRLYLLSACIDFNLMFRTFPILGVVDRMCIDTSCDYRSNCLINCVHITWVRDWWYAKNAIRLCWWHCVRCCCRWFGESFLDHFYFSAKCLFFLCLNGGLGRHTIRDALHFDQN